MRKSIRNTTTNESGQTVLTIHVNPLRVSNKEHMRACERFPARVFEDKRLKKPKHKVNYKNFENF